MPPTSSWPTAEQATIAAAVRDPGFCAQLLDAGPDVLLHDTSRRAWDVLQRLTQSGHPVDKAAVEAALGSPIVVAPSTDYWPVLLEERLRRQLQLLGQWLQKPRDRIAPTTVAARALQSLNAALMATQSTTIYSGDAAVRAGIARLAQGEPHWLASGIPLWDAATAAWGPDDFVIVGARPSQGKTALGVQWAWNTAASGRGIAFASVEMGPEMIGLRAVAQHLGWSLDELRVQITHPDVEQSLKTLARWPWHVLDANAATVADLQAAVARADVLGARCDVVIIDYVQLLRAARGSAQNREQEVARMVASLKTWARRDHRLIVALSQLSRKTEERRGHIPTLGDLRESGAIEQDADAVVLIHHAEENPDQAQLIVAKNRNGPTGAVPVRWQARTAQFFARNP